jgi:hypothetical protein
MFDEVTQDGESLASKLHCLFAPLQLYRHRV